LVIDTAKVHDGGLDVVDMDWFICDVPAKLIGGANDMTSAYTASCHPPTESFSKVVSAIGFVWITLAKRRSSKFTGPDDQGIVEQSAFFEIFDEGCGWAFGVFALFGKLGK
jgi:hypothetical protein